MSSFKGSFLFIKGGICMEQMKLPNSEDGKRLAEFIKAEIEAAKKEIIKELKPKTPKK